MFDDKKIIISKNKISIFSYDALLELSIEKIIIDNIVIIGDNLRIEEMDEYYIIVTGTLNEVKFINE